MVLRSSWLVVWNMFYFLIYWECHHPNWLSYFSHGLKPPTRLPWYPLKVSRMIFFRIPPAWFLSLSQTWMGRVCSIYNPRFLIDVPTKWRISYWNIWIIEYIYNLHRKIMYIYIYICLHLWKINICIGLGPFPTHPAACRHIQAGARRVLCATNRDSMQASGATGLGKSKTSGVLRHWLYWIC